MNYTVKKKVEGKEAPYFEVANVMKYRSFVFFSVPIMISIPTKIVLSSTSVNMMNLFTISALNLQLACIAFNVRE